MKLPHPARTILHVGPRFNNTHATLSLDLRHWAVGLSWHRSYSGMSSYLNLWTFNLGVPLFTLEVVIRHRPIP